MSTEDGNGDQEPQENTAERIIRERLQNAQDAARKTGESISRKRKPRPRKPIRQPTVRGGLINPETGEYTPLADKARPRKPKDQK